MGLSLIVRVIHYAETAADCFRVQTNEKRCGKGNEGEKNIIHRPTCCVPNRSSAELLSMRADRNLAGPAANNVYFNESRSGVRLFQSPPGHPNPNLVTSTHRAEFRLRGHPPVVVVVGGGGVPPPPPLLLLDKIRMPNAMTTPAPTSQSNGGSLSPCACFTPAADPGARGPVSADIAGNGPITIAALTSIEISALFTLSSLFGYFVSAFYHRQD